MRSIRLTTTISKLYIATPDSECFATQSHLGFSRDLRASPARHDFFSFAPFSGSERENFYGVVNPFLPAKLDEPYLTSVPRPCPALFYLMVNG